ncbi:MAG: AAA family ATPase [Cuniculiplasma sp.]
MNFNIGITGVPGTGKTTICRMLEERGYEIVDMNLFSMENGCTHGDDVDIDCLNSIVKENWGKILDSHYSHLLSCYAVIEMYCSPETLQERLDERGYERAKIEENMDCLMIDCIGSECIENFPQNRILRLNSEQDDGTANLNKAVSFIEKMEAKHNGSGFL